MAVFQSWTEIRNVNHCLTKYQGTEPLWLNKCLCNTVSLLPKKKKQETGNKQVLKVGLKVLLAGTGYINLCLKGYIFFVFIF